MKLTLRMLNERKNSNAELMKHVIAILSETEKQMKELQHEEDDDVLLEGVKNKKSSSGAQIKRIDPNVTNDRLDAIEWTLKNISTDLNVILKKLKN